MKRASRDSLAALNHAGVSFDAGEACSPSDKQSAVLLRRRIPNKFRVPFGLLKETANRAAFNKQRFVKEMPRLPCVMR